MMAILEFRIAANSATSDIFLSHNYIKYIAVHIYHKVDIHVLQ